VNYYKYCQNLEKWRSKDEDSKEQQSHTEKALDIVKSFIERFIILGKSVVKLNEMGEIYVSELAREQPNRWVDMVGPMLARRKIFDGEMCSLLANVGI
jgi:hypothetical protein